MTIKNLSQVFAENVLYYRNKLGYSQYDLANKSNIKRSTICHYEKEGIIPSTDRLQILANSLSIPVYKLFKQRTSEKKSDAELFNIDPRSIKKLQDILSLPQEDRNDLYRILNIMLRKNQLEKQNQIKNNS